MSHQLKVYKIVALVFLLSVIASSIFVIHFALSKASIIVTTSQRPITVEKEFNIKIEDTGTDLPTLEELTEQLKILQLSIIGDDDSSQKPSGSVKYDLAGHLFETEVFAEKTFKPGSQTKSIEGIATGMVSVINDANYDQTLVKTTRLLTPDNVLFRIDKTIVVPRKGSAEVTAYADIAGASGDIGPTTFTIPGLSQSSQKLIYAKNAKPFTGGVSNVSIVTQSDIMRAQIALTEELENKGLVELNKMHSNISLKDLFSEVSSLNSSVSEGESAQDFKVSATLSVSAINFDKEVLRELMKSEIQRQLSADEMVFAYDEENFDYVITNFDKKEKSAKVMSSLKAYVTLKTEDAVNTKQRLVGKNQEEVQLFFLKNPNVSAVSVQFWPFWVSKVPKLKDRISLQMITVEGDPSGAKEPAQEGSADSAGDGSEGGQDEPSDNLSPEEALSNAVIPAEEGVPPEDGGAAQ